MPMPELMFNIGQLAGFAQNEGFSVNFRPGLRGDSAFMQTIDAIEEAA